jgi:hypothetical protein
MEERDIQQRFHLLEKEVEAAVSVIEETKLNLRSAIDAVIIEVEVLKRFLARSHPDFTALYPQLREQVMRELDPEWVGKG